MRKTPNLISTIGFYTAFGLTLIVIRMEEGANVLRNLSAVFLLIAGTANLINWIKWKNSKKR